MKKLLIILAVLFGLFKFSNQTLAQVVTLYRTESTMNIYTKFGYNTIIYFPSPIKLISGGNEAFIVTASNERSSVTIIPKQCNIKTNLAIETRDGLIYSFRLIEEAEKNTTEFYEVVKMKVILNVDYRQMINICNKKIVDIDPALRSFVNIYDIKDAEYDVKHLNMGFIIKRAVTVEMENKTVFWIQIENQNFVVNESNETEESKPETNKFKLKSKTKVDSKDHKASVNDLKIPVNKISIKEREIFAVALESNKEILRPGEFLDIYIIAEGAYIDSSYTFQLNVNGKEESYYIKNIPYDKQEFKIFVPKDNYYDYQTVNEYRR